MHHVPLPRRRRRAASRKPTRAPTAPDALEPVKTRSRASGAPRACVGVCSEIYYPVTGGLRDCCKFTSPCLFRHTSQPNSFRNEGAHQALLDGNVGQRPGPVFRSIYASHGSLQVTSSRGSLQGDAQRRKSAPNHVCALNR
jgi:hypothetical protein